MSESPQDSSASESSPGPKTGGGSRKAFYAVLVLIGLVAAVICYDLYVASRAVQAAFDKVADASLKAMAAEETLTNLEVRELLDKEPSDTQETDEGHVEVFHWIGSVMGPPHQLHTVYKKDGDDYVLIRHFKIADKKDASVVDVDPNAVNEDENYENGGRPAPAGEADEAQASGGEDGDEVSDPPEIESEDGSAGESGQ